MDEKEKYDEETHFENEKWRAEAGYKFLQEIHSRQQEEMKESGHPPTNSNHFGKSKKISHLGAEFTFVLVLRWHDWN